jgi:hypothetical protein
VRLLDVAGALKALPEIPFAVPRLDQTGTDQDK